MRKLFIITRDGKSANDFLESHGLTKDNVIIAKTASAFKSIKGGERYVIVPPLPFSFEWAIRPLLTCMTNVTKSYNNHLIKF